MAAAMSASDATFDWAEATLGPSIPLMSVVTWNCSPAPSQSDAVTIGVLTYWKPCCWKKVCVAYASWFLTRVTAPMVLVLGLRCAMPRRYSRVCLFFCRGKVDASAPPMSLMDSTATSTACLPPGDSTTVPSMSTAAPVVMSPASRCSRPGTSPFTTAWMPLSDEPSFTSMNERSFCARTVRTQPRSCTVSPTRDLPWSLPWDERKRGVGQGLGLRRLGREKAEFCG